MVEKVAVVVARVAVLVERAAIEVMVERVKVAVERAEVKLCRNLDSKGWISELGGGSNDDKAREGDEGEVDNSHASDWGGGESSFAWDWGGSSSISNRGSGPSEASEMLLEDTTLLLATDKSVGSIWSTNNTQDGTIIEESSISSGPSPSQCIADDWRQANPQFIAPAHPSLTSAVSLTNTAHPSTSSSMSFSTTASCSSSPPPSPRKIPLNAWKSKENHPVRHVAAMKQVAKASACAITLRILGDWNAV